MKIHQKEPFAIGYNSITEINGKYSEMLMDFGILKLGPNTKHKDEENLEKVYLLLSGEVRVKCDGKSYRVKRENFLDDKFWAINTPHDVSIEVEGISDESEMAVVRTENNTKFNTVVRDVSNSTMETRGKGAMNEAGTRIVKTLMDKKLAPESNIMLGEDTHYPGKWAGFPSHHHEQPEIYFYKFMPENGFGLLKRGNDAVLLEHNDTVTIDPNLDHPQVAAPGYAMYFLWIIRHLEGNPYIKPTFDPQHLWVEKPGAKYWPDC